MDKGIHNDRPRGWGGKREGAGRPRVEELRKMRAMRATDDEWELIQSFAKLVKYGDKAACQNFLDEQEQLVAPKD